VAQLGEGPAQLFSLVREGGGALGNQAFQLHVLGLDNVLGFFFFLAQQPVFFQRFFLTAGNEDERYQPDNHKALSGIHEGIQALGDFAVGLFYYQFQRFVDHERGHGEEQCAGRFVVAHGQQRGQHH